MIEIVHLDLNIVEHCNFRCSGCSHASPILKPWSMSLEEIEHDLSILKPILRPRNITVVGGEPTLHKQLVDILRLLKKIRIDKQTWVLSNGSLLDRMSEDFWKELEYLRISVYPKLDKSLLELPRSKAKQYGFGLELMPCDEFYKQLEAIPDGSSFHKCPWKTDCYTVHRGYFYLCPQTTFFPKALMGLTDSIDGLPLEGITEQKLHDFMNRTTPFNTCRTCRAYGVKMPWQESKGREQWIKDSTI